MMAVDVRRLDSLMTDALHASTTRRQEIAMEVLEMLHQADAGHGLVRLRDALVRGEDVEQRARALVG